MKKMIKKGKQPIKRKQVRKSTSKKLPIKKKVVKKPALKKASAKKTSSKSTIGRIFKKIDTIYEKKKAQFKIGKLADDDDNEEKDHPGPKKN